ncbi:lysoplasmalogenase [Paenibacillus puldeungensis]|uniref:Lysoplasmalogenase n=1 Tax=Paenibacillus puldeungensis TaxID=696536 RepID=A0ABW3S240_9BACL
MLKKWIVAAMILSGLGYLLVYESDFSILKWILKPGTVLFIICYAALSDKASRSYRNLIVAGLLASAAGDCFLLMPGNQWFLWGLGSFLIAHLLYISAFLSRQRFAFYHCFYMIPLVIYEYWLLERLGEGLRLQHNEQLWVPIVVYVLVISVMLWTAIVSRNWLASIGAFSFVFSDSLLAWNMVIEPVSWAGLGVMISYYLAQFLIAASIRSHQGGWK